MKEARAIVSDAETEKAGPATAVDTRVLGEQVEAGTTAPEDGTEAGSASDSAEDRELGLVEAERLLELGHIERAEGEYPEAEHCYLSALEFFQKHGDRAGEGEAIRSLGGIHQRKGELDRATELLTQSIDIAREIGNKRSEGNNLDNLGLVYQRKGDLDRAVELYTQAIDIAREIGNRGSEGTVLGNLGLVHKDRGELDRAVECFQQSIDIAREMGRRDGEGIGIGNLGSVYEVRGELDRAAECFQQSIDIAREIGNKESQGINLGNLGEILFLQDRLEEAEDAFRQAIPFADQAFPLAAGHFRGSLALLLAQKDQFDEAQDLLKAGESQVAPYPEEHAKFLCKTGQVQLLAGEHKDAQGSLRQAREIAADLNFHDGSEVTQAIRELETLIEGSAGEETRKDNPSEERLVDGNLMAVLEGDRLVELGRIQYEESRFDEASEHFQAALAIYRAHRHRRGEGEALMGLGSVCWQTGKLTEATKTFNLALGIHREIGDRQLEGVVLGDLGNVCQQQQKLDEAIVHYTLALEIHRAYGDERFEGDFLGNMAEALFDLGRLAESKQAFESAISICDATDNRTSAGSFRGCLALLLAKQGHFDDAQALVDKGEPQLASHPHNHGKFLCKKGQVQLLKGEREEAGSSLTQAQAIAAELEVGEDSEMAREIAALVAVLEKEP
jgi:tetratricopeptide (TPR) repeat protein